jgi:copper chaperone NosL
MTISEKRYAAQLIDGEGKAHKFDDIGCMVNSAKKNNQNQVRARFVMDYDKQEWIKAENAFYVRSNEFATPMNYGFVAFKTQAGANAAAAKYRGTLLRFADVFNSKK